LLKRDKGKSGAEAGTNLTSDVGTAIKTPNSCMKERKKKKERKIRKEYDEENKESKFRNRANRNL
jgi:hypothetical protein